MGSFTLATRRAFWRLRGFAFAIATHLPFGGMEKAAGEGGLWFLLEMFDSVAASAWDLCHAWNPRVPLFRPEADGEAYAGR
jgi:hypothetical protein